MKFKIPKSYQAPDGVEEDEDFQEMATFKFNGGDMTLVSIGENEFPVGKPEKSMRPKGAKQAVEDRMAEMESDE